MTATLSSGNNQNCKGGEGQTATLNGNIVCYLNGNMSE